MWQQISLIGNAGQDPEMRYLPDGTAVTNVSIATNRTWNDPASGEKQQQTTWWRVSFWGKTAEVITEYLNKGDKIFVQGVIQPDPQTGGAPDVHPAGWHCRCLIRGSGLQLQILAGQR